MPDAPNNRKDPRQGSPLSAWKGSATEKGWPKRPSDHQLQVSKKDSDRAITPAEAVRVPAHLALPGSLQVEQPCHPRAQLSLGQSCHRQKKKKSWVALVLSSSLQPSRLWPARLLCQRGDSPGKHTGAYWPILVATPFESTIFPAALASNPLSTWCCQNPWDPSSCTTSTPGPHRGKPKSSRADSGANPSGRPQCRGGNKTTMKTQGQRG